MFYALYTAGWPGEMRPRVKRVLQMFCKQWPYVGFAIFLATLNLLLGILTLSYLKPKKEGLLFGIICFAIIMALAHFASLCHMIQRAKNETSDPTLLDAACAVGLIFMFAFSGIALTVQLPKKCFSGQNEDLLVIGRGSCTAITAMAVFSWLGVLTMILAAAVIFLRVWRLLEEAKLPPPVFSAGTEAPVMRWLNRNDGFLSVSESRQQSNV